MPPQGRERWTREQQLVALRLYVRLPFGRLHGRNPEIVKLASKIGRTPAALAMKACNFASLDPAFRATNRRGLSGASAGDRELWDEFIRNPEAIAAEAEAVVDAFEGTVAQSTSALAPTQRETEVVRTVRARRVQSFFRAAVLTSYGGRCAISNLRVRPLLNASHIIPWSHSVERRADPTNGICLNVLFDRAFDRGLLTISEDMSVELAPALLRAARNAQLGCSILEAHGRRISLPIRFAPDEGALAYHREHIFKRC